MKKFAWHIIRTNDFKVVRFFESQKIKPFKVDYIDGEWFVIHKINARNDIERKMISKLLTNKAKQIETLE